MRTPSSIRAASYRLSPYRRVPLADIDGQETDFSHYAVRRMRFLAVCGKWRVEHTEEAKVKRLSLALAVVAVVLTSSVAAASMLSGSPSPSPRREKNPAHLAPGKGTDESDEAGAGIHGGPIQRFHQAGGCSLVDVSTLQGNWTHGDYVAAVAALGDSSLIPTAAHSECGKPMVAVGQEHGPPDFVLQKLKAHKTSGGKAPNETPGS